MNVDDGGSQHAAGRVPPSGPKSSTRPIALVSILAIAAIVMLSYLREPPLCRDDLRDIQTQISSGVTASVEQLSGLSLRLEGSDRQKATEIISRLSNPEYAALRVLNLQCQALATCSRWVFFRSISDACPREYSDLNRRIDQLLSAFSSNPNNVLTLLEKLKEALRKLDAAQEQLRQAASMPGATGGLYARLEAEKQALQLQTTNILQQIDEITGSWDR